MIGQSRANAGGCRGESHMSELLSFPLNYSVTLRAVRQESLWTPTLTAIPAPAPTLYECTDKQHKIYSEENKHIHNKELTKWECSSADSCLAGTFCKVCSPQCSVNTETRGNNCMPVDSVINKEKCQDNISQAFYINELPWKQYISKCFLIQWCIQVNMTYLTIHIVSPLKTVYLKNKEVYSKNEY